VSSPHLKGSEKAILAALEERPLSSVWEFSEATCLPRMTVDRRLTNSLGSIPHHLRCVPCLLSGAQKVQVQRIKLSSSLLRMLEVQVQVQEQRTWYDIVTFDESWCYDSIDHESIWLQPSEKVPERTRVTITIQCKN
jgi:hypothetical protein